MSLFVSLYPTKPLYRVCFLESGEITFLLSLGKQLRFGGFFSDILECLCHVNRHLVLLFPFAHLGTLPHHKTYCL